MRRWYVGTMNDAVFIIDTPPRPAPVDSLTAGYPETVVIAALGAGTEATLRTANEIVAAHNTDMREVRMAERKTILHVIANGPSGTAAARIESLQPPT